MTREGVLRRLGLAVVLAALLLTGLASALRAETPVQAVRLIIDHGDGSVRIYTDIPWIRGETILDVLNAARVHAHGISFAYAGRGATALLTAIDGLTNQGSGANSKHWQYWVNTTYGDRSFAVWNVQALDTVIWQFAPYQGR